MDLISKYQSIIEQALEDHSFRNMEPSELYEPCNYLLNIGGKRLRPIMVLLGARLFGENIEDAIKPALAIEFFHNFSLMHDDIMDVAPLRRGEPTVHMKYDVNSAILSGDALIVKSYQMLEDLPKGKFREVTKLFSKTAAEVCEGQQYDMNFETQDQVSYNEYIQMITLKTGVMVGCAFNMGAIVNSAKKEDAEYLYKFGKNIGIAYQLKDDYLDVFGTLEDFGKQHAGDIYENKKTILYIKALELAQGEEEKELRFWYGMKTENIDKVYAVEKLFWKLRVDQEVMKLINKYTEKAKFYLDKINAPEEIKKELLKLASSLIDRTI